MGERHVAAYGFDDLQGTVGPDVGNDDHQREGLQIGLSLAGPLAVGSIENEVDPAQLLTIGGENGFIFLEILFVQNYGVGLCQHSVSVLILTANLLNSPLFLAIFVVNYLLFLLLLGMNVEKSYFCKSNLNIFGYI